MEKQIKELEQLERSASENLNALSNQYCDIWNKALTLLKEANENDSDSYVFVGTREILAEMKERLFRMYSVLYDLLVLQYKLINSDRFICNFKIDFLSKNEDR